MTDRIRALVAEDSPTVRRRIVEVLTAADDLEVVGEAADGRQAIELCMALRPDVITLDMMMPVVTGLAATEYIMAYCPTPIVIVSGSTNRGEMFRTYEALSAGALEIVEKPRADDRVDAWEARLVDTVRVASRVRVITHPRGRLRANWDFEPSLPLPLPPPAARTRPAASGPRLVALGASTGGPKAIVDLLESLPADFAWPILIVTHISEAFANGFVDWLGANAPLNVRLARDGDLVDQAGVTVAPADRHLVLDGDRLHLTLAPPRHSCRPSVDVLFESVARSQGARAIGILLTGMGRDGAEGLLQIRRRGGLTMAQDEASSVIFGMPAEAIRLDAADLVLPPAAMGMLLSRMPAEERH